MPPIARRRMSRRDFLKVTGVGLAGTSFLGMASCTGGSGGGTGSEFTLTFGPDDTGSLQKAIDRFNEEYSGQYKASYREMPADTGPPSLRRKASSSTSPTVSPKKSEASSSLGL